jgi:sigma-B regulation protein RsbU (phosphoserine phosphatase)
MLLAPLPANEAERLADLRALKLLDTPPEERFDRIVQLATHLFEVPIAYIALIDSDRQWFKATCGLQMTQTDRSISFCGHTILQDTPLIIPDASQDTRFQDNPLVLSEPRVRFYAGHPLTGLKGKNVGTLCLVDQKPRSLDPRKLETFRRLASLAEHELQMVDLIDVQHELLATKTALLETQQKLQRELAEAANYIQSILPPPGANGAVHTDWQFISSSQLGGDLFGYHWLDKEHLALYLLDVCGHGIGASLLSISVYSALRRQTLADTVFHDPGSVLTALNRAFPMEDHQGKFFTMWYGVYNHQTRQLRFANAGHPPALLFHPDHSHDSLAENDPVIGVLPDFPYTAHEQAIPEGSRLYLFSDGTFEVYQTRDEMLGVEGLSGLLEQAGRAGSESRVRWVVEQIQKLQGKSEFNDDFSLMEVMF